MRSESFLGGVRRVDEQSQRLLTLRTFSGPGPVRRIEIAMLALVDLAELLRASAPFPPQFDPQDDDALVDQLVEASYEQGPTPVERFGSKTTARIAATNRLKIVDSWVIVPLSATGPYAHNWRPMIGTLLHRLESVIETFRRVSRRARGTDPDRAFTAGCEGVVDMLETLSQIVRQADADSRYVRDRTDHRQGELLSRIGDATTQLRSDDNA